MLHCRIIAARKVGQMPGEASAWSWDFRVSVPLVFSVRYNFNGSYYLFSCFRRGGLKGREMLTALF